MSKIIFVDKETNILQVMTMLDAEPDVASATARVPKGCKFKIVEDSDIPSDRTFRDAWEVAESELTDGVGA